MLVMTRREGEAAVILLPDGRAIRVELRERRSGGGSRIGFEAPSDVKILREELLLRGDQGAGQSDVV